MERECTECGEIIPPRRLEIIPDSQMCAVCQMRAEEAGADSKHKMEISQEMTGGWFCEGVKYKIVKRG